MINNAKMPSLKDKIASSAEQNPAPVEVDETVNEKAKSVKIKSKKTNE